MTEDTMVENNSQTPTGGNNAMMWVAGGALVLILLGGFLVLRNQSSQSGTSGAQPTTTEAKKPEVTEGMQKEATVEYTDNGFNPKTLTVKSGTTVKFVNNSREDMWVASNPHPRHTDYFGLDEKKGEAKGATYSFTFSKVGKWGFHNHLDPSDGGTVVVE